MTEQHFKIVEYSQTAAALVELRTRYAREFDVATTKGMAEAKEARAEIRSYRVAIEKLRAELKAPVLERSRLIDSEAKRITTELLAIEDPIDAAIKAEERRKEEEKAAKARAEAERVNLIKKKVDGIRKGVTQFIGGTSSFIRVGLLWTSTYEPDPKEFLEFLPDAIAARDEAHKTLETMLAERLKIEEEQDRLAELQRQLEAEQQRQAEERRRQAEENRKIEEQRALLERQQREAAEREAKAKRQQEEEARKAQETERRRQAEEKRQAEEAERIARETRERENQELAEWQRIDPIMHLAIAINYKRMTIEEALRAAYQMGVESVAQTEHAA